MDDVLIVGAGPTGLVLALWLTKQGIRVRIIDKSTGPGETSRAIAVQARTLELYRQLGIADKVSDAGLKTLSMNLWARGEKKAQIVIGDAGADVTPFPYILMYPQDHHERLLVDHLRSLGVEVERQTEMLGLEDKVEQVEVRVRTKDGMERIYGARYVAGCDGARSPVRHAVGNQFEGGTYKQVFYVADVALGAVDGENQAHISLDTDDFVVVLPYGGGRYRLIGTVRDERTEHPESLTFEDVGHRAIESMCLTIRQVDWFSTYRVHHRVTDRFRHGRIFLLGDAAHVHSPAGGQGMNTGVLDAINLAWKLAAVLNGRAPDSLLDSYDAERRSFALKLVDTTDRIFTFVTAQGGFADFVRTRIAPTLASAAYRIGSIREMIFRMISQTTLSYDQSPLSQGKAGSIEGGDRLPWVREADNYAPLAEIGFQVHVYGEPSVALRKWATDHGLSLHAFAWTDAHEKLGLARDALYLLRPDTWVALADSSQSIEALEGYFASRGIVLTENP
ncbi:monooxygenase FAD-binding protein [Rhizobium sp. PDO1-076]|uniref:FAD-dependent oxidoreductase n=1 Tax=Rhizobium sp. PDO1-076 TaxID=1125979 RepID=UPI00024E2ED0|nr:FAD-dependent oxidoreductase [Rhizobium sp. PDO1-076]EHS52278.1 monooxygenase FAD-binding protein [Rhizobium sp. PDO1-076]